MALGVAELLEFCFWTLLRPSASKMSIKTSSVTMSQNYFKPTNIYTIFLSYFIFHVHFSLFEFLLLFKRLRLIIFSLVNWNVPTQLVLVNQPYSYLRVSLCCWLLNLSLN